MAKRTTGQTPEEAQPKRLSLRVEKFLAHYVKHGNATQAAIFAGYSHKTAAEMGYENLRKPHIKARLEEIRAEMWAGVKVHRDEIVQELLNYVRFDPTQFLEIDESDNLRLRKGVDIEGSKALKYMTLSTSVSESSSSEGSSWSKSVSFAQPMKAKAFDLLCKMEGFCAPKPKDPAEGSDSRSRESAVAGAITALRRRKK